MNYGIDAPGTVCAFDSNHCSASMSGHGGFQLHHRWPKFLGGPENQADLLALCPSHHVRQHALVRYLVEHGPAPEWDVVQHFTAAERATAIYAVAQWRIAGSPPIAAWEVPAAR